MKTKSFVGMPNNSDRNMKNKVKRNEYYMKFFNFNS